MYNINIICIGTLKEKYLTEACNEYLKRLKAYCRVNIIELDECRTGPGRDADILAALRREGENIIKKIPPSSYTIGMFISGREMSSAAFAERLGRLALEKSSTVNFIIGGSHGLSEDVRKVCDETMSLSPMTFPHHLFRIILLDQLYRAFSIMNCGNYQK